MSSEEPEKRSGEKRKRAPMEKKDFNKGKEQAARKFKVELQSIKNAQKRQEVYSFMKKAKSKQKMQDRKARKLEREALGDAAPKPFIKSIDKMREPEQSIVDPNDEEIAEDEANDEFSKYFNGLPPKVAITTRQNPTKISKEFVCNMQDLIPGLTYYKRRDFPLKKIIKYLKNKEYTDLIVVGENLKKIDGLMIIHLPDGPTATFKLSSLKYPEQIPDRGIMSSHHPELILNNFTTRMGHGIGRMFASLFPQVPEFTGRRIITFHNQRDFIFVRQHRYIFEPDKENKLKPRIQELGPRMTLKLIRLQHGTFDTTEGEFEWFMTNKMYESSKKFFM
jgi:ribosome production factor 1